MSGSPLEAHVLFQLGPVAVTVPVVVTWLIMAALGVAARIVTKSLSLAPSRSQAALELIVSAIEEQIRGTMRSPQAPYVPLIGTLFLFILIANWSSLIPGIDPPTAHIETDAALALVVFGATIYFGVRARGPTGYLKTFMEPTWLMAPLNFIETFTRTFSLIVRLFGNVMSGSLYHRRHSVAGRPAGADPADGARSPDRSRPSLHLQRTRDGVYCECRCGRHAAETC